MESLEALQLDTGPDAENTRGTRITSSALEFVPSGQAQQDAPQFHHAWVFLPVLSHSSKTSAAICVWEYQGLFIIFKYFCHLTTRISVSYICSRPTQTFVSRCVCLYLPKPRTDSSHADAGAGSKFLLPTPPRRGFGFPSKRQSLTDLPRGNHQAVRQSTHQSELADPSVT